MIKFKSCPDCGSNKYPNFNREQMLYSDNTVASQPVYASCHICGWRTDTNDTVAECAEEWNNSGMNKKEDVTLPSNVAVRMDTFTDEVTLMYPDGTSKAISMKEFDDIMNHGDSEI